MGAKHVLIKGGHLSQEKMPQIYYMMEILSTFVTKRIPTKTRTARAVPFPLPLLQTWH